ncbi:MAG: LysE family transporter, partial [Betaproteobacteria bacterium]
MSTEAWALLALTLLAGAASPGPSLALVIQTALIQGRSAAILVALAHGFGVWLYALGVVFGIGLFLLHSEWIMQMLQVVGALFLGYL